MRNNIKAPALYWMFRMHLKNSNIHFEKGIGNQLMIAVSDDCLFISFIDEGYVRFSKTSDPGFYLLIQANTISRLIGKISIYRELLNHKIVDPIMVQTP